MATTNAGQIGVLQLGLGPKLKTYLFKEWYYTFASNCLRSWVTLIPQNTSGICGTKGFGSMNVITY